MTPEAQIFEVAGSTKPKPQIAITADVPMPHHNPRNDWSWIKQMQVGQSAAMPIVYRRLLAAACYHEHKRTGRTFLGEVRTEGGVEVYRIWRQS